MGIRQIGIYQRQQQSSQQQLPYTLLDLQLQGLLHGLTWRLLGICSCSVCCMSDLEGGRVVHHTACTLLRYSALHAAAGPHMPHARLAPS